MLKSVPHLNCVCSIMLQRMGIINADALFSFPGSRSGNLLLIVVPILLYRVWFEVSASYVYNFIVWEFISLRHYNVHWCRLCTPHSYAVCSLLERSQIVLKSHVAVYSRYVQYAQAIDLIFQATVVIKYYFYACTVPLVYSLFQPTVHNICCLF
jgi:hypothetical protein